MFRLDEALKVYLHREPIRLPAEHARLWHGEHVARAGVHALAFPTWLQYVTQNTLASLSSDQTGQSRWRFIFRMALRSSITFGIRTAYFLSACSKRARWCMTSIWKTTGTEASRISATRPTGPRRFVSFERGTLIWLPEAAFAKACRVPFTTATQLSSRAVTSLLRR